MNWQWNCRRSLTALAQKGGFFPARSLLLRIRSNHGHSHRSAIREGYIYGRFRATRKKGPEEKRPKEKRPEEIAPEEKALPGREPDDVPWLAGRVAEDTPFRGRLAAGDVDWLEICTRSEKPVHVGLEFSEPGAGVDLVGCDAKGHRIYRIPVLKGTGSGAGSGAGFGADMGAAKSAYLRRTSPPPGGRLLLKLTAPAKSAGRECTYVCRVRRAEEDGHAEREVNDRLDLAMPLPWRENESKITGSLRNADDVDIYSFVVAPGTPRRYTIILSRIEGRDTFFSLMGPDTDVSPGLSANASVPPVIRKADDSPYPSREVLSGWLPENPGEYFLIIGTRSGHGGSGYTLTVKRHAR